MYKCAIVTALPLSAVPVRNLIGLNPTPCYKGKERKTLPMRTTQQMSITLPLDMAQLVKDKVSSGSYASESEVIREGIRALQEREAAVERWLREEVAPSYDAHKANPGRASDLADVTARLDAFMDTAEQKKAR